jgi:hypothetical protein
MEERSFNPGNLRSFDDLPDRYQAALHLALSMTPEEFRDNYDTEGPLEGSLDLLAEFHGDHARAVYDSMVSNTDEVHRMRLTDSVDVIFSHDPEYGYALWDRLIGDPISTVRRNAREVLEEHLREGEHPNNLFVGEPYLGQLTWRGACNLLRTFAAAEVDGIRYAIGPVVLEGAGVEVLPPDESAPQAPGTDPTVT